MHKPLIVGITGGIGSGKSTLSKHLRAEGFFVFDTDQKARQLQNEHIEVKSQMQELFGKEIYTSEGLNRPALAKIVFDKKELLASLNKIIHPYVRKSFNDWIAEHKSEKFLFVESAIMFESGLVNFVDKVVLMTASEETRIARVVKRDGVNPEQVKARIAHQMPDQKKIKGSDFVINTDDQLPMADKMKSLLADLSKLK